MVARYGGRKALGPMLAATRGLGLRLAFLGLPLRQRWCRPAFHTKRQHEAEAERTHLLTTSRELCMLQGREVGSRVPRVRDGS